MLLFNFRWVMAQQASSKSRSHRGLLYECRSCPVMCDRRGMVAHIVSKHKLVREAPVYCTVCDCKYVVRRDWARHRADVHHQTCRALRPQLVRGCMGSNPDGVPLDGPTARAVSLSKAESDKYRALITAAKDSKLVLESPSESEDNNPWEQGGVDMDHFVFDMPEREIITQSREIPSMTEHLVGFARLPANQSPGTEKSASPSPAHVTSVRPASSDSVQETMARNGKQAKNVTSVRLTSSNSIQESTARHRKQTKSATSVRPASSDSMQESTARHGNQAKGATAACSASSDSAQWSTSHQSQQAKGTTGVCPAPKSTQKTAAASTATSPATCPSKRKTENVIRMSPHARLPQETSGAPASEETPKTSKKKAPTGVLTSDLSETVSSPPCVPKPFERTSHQDARPSTATQAPHPPSLNTKAWSRVYTRMADVVGAAVREGHAAGFEYFGQAMEQQNTLIIRSLSDSADVQAAILCSLNPNRSANTSSREPGTGSRHHFPARWHGEQGTRQRRFCSPKRKRHRDSQDR